MIFLKILSLDRGRDGDENFFFTNFFFIAITTAIKTVTSKILHFFSKSVGWPHILKNEKKSRCAKFPVLLRNKFIQKSSDTLWG
jgi:hypothetical protein